MLFSVPLSFGAPRVEVKFAPKGYLCSFSRDFLVRLGHKAIDRAFSPSYRKARFYNLAVGSTLFRSTFPSQCGRAGALSNSGLRGIGCLWQRPIQMDPTYVTEVPGIARPLALSPQSPK